jgi:mannose/fructose/N-acetylgalactosamine-specific phosphotransferase system component IIC
MIVVGLVIGAALGLIVIGFLSIGSYERGYDAAIREQTLRRRHA